mmetsp:Transcript_81366/g.230516  ORF Transcript_81366/g.230516 Transcript_81366/m.230516 type:complete len:332 (+) Transcript_81366:63-1058(+)
MAPQEPESDDEKLLSKDKYGEAFKDYGFLKCAEEHRSLGNEQYKDQSFQRALQEYEAALQLLTAIAEDRAITVGEQMWDDIIVFRSLVQLNKSACHHKLGQWAEAIDAAVACLAGNLPVELQHTYPHILANTRPQDIPTVDTRVPKPARAKAWFRISDCQLRLGFFARAKSSAAKAAKVCESDSTRKMLAAHSKRILAVEKRERLHQKQQYWGKMEAQGGYVKQDSSSRARRHRRGAPGPADREALDGSDGDSNSDFEGVAEADPAKPMKPMIAWEAPESREAGAQLAGQGPSEDRAMQAWRRRQEEEQLRAKAWEEDRASRLVSRLGFAA